jgi:hypothetical protein
MIMMCHRSFLHHIVRAFVHENHIYEEMNNWAYKIMKEGQGKKHRCGVKQCIRSFGFLLFRINID